MCEFLNVLTFRICCKELFNVLWVKEIMSTFLSEFLGTINEENTAFRIVLL